jgi:hypothetical protein
MQVEAIKQGDAKSFRVQILTPVEPLRLHDYESCRMDLAESEDTFDSPVLTLDSNNSSSEAFFYDRANGMVQYNFVSSQTQALDPAQYPFKMKVIKDSEHVYTFHEGIIEIQA